MMYSCNKAEISNRNARVLLEGYRPSLHRIPILTNELNRLIASQDAAKPLPPDTGAGAKHFIGGAAEAVKKVRRELERETARCRLAADALSALGQPGINPEVLVVMEAHYLDGKSLKRISDEMHYSLNTIKRRNRMGLAAVESYLSGQKEGGLANSTQSTEYRGASDPASKPEDLTDG